MLFPYIVIQIDIKLDTTENNLAVHMKRHTALIFSVMYSIVYSQNSDVEALTVFGDRAFKEVLKVQ